LTMPFPYPGGAGPYPGAASASPHHARPTSPSLIPPPPPLLRTTVDASHDPGLILSASTAGEVLHLNAAARRLFERGRRDAVSRRTVFSFFSITPTSIDRLPGGEEDEKKAAKGRGRGRKARDAWAAVVRNLGTGAPGSKHAAREAVAYLPDGSTFPATVHLFKHAEDAGGEGRDENSGSKNNNGGGRNDSGAGDEDETDDSSRQHAYVCAFVKDQTHDRLLGELEKQLRDLDAENLRLRRSQDALVVASGDSTVIIDEEGIIHSLDAVTERTFGYSSGELVGRNVSVLMGPEHSGRHDGYIRRYLRTGEKRVMGKKREVMARRRDGSSIRVELGISEIKTDPWDRRMFAGMLRDVSERDAAFRMLERSERLRDAILNANKDAMLSLSTRGKIETANKAATDMFGWTEEELRGRHITCLVAPKDVEEVREDLVNGGIAATASAAPSRANSSLTDDDSASDAMSISTAGTNTIAVDRELTGIRKDGSTFPISFDLARISSKSVPGKSRPCAAFVRDLTKRKAQEYELARESSVNRSILEASFDSIFLIDERGTILVANRASTEQFGWTKEDFLGQNIAMICGGPHAGRHDEYMRRYLRTGRTGVMGKRRTLPARRKDGTEFDIELGLVEVDTSSVPPMPPTAPSATTAAGNVTDGEDGEGRMFCAFVRDVSVYPAPNTAPPPPSSFPDEGNDGDRSPA